MAYPPELVNALGGFDLDPCSPINRPWPTAKKHFTITDNGLWMPWIGRVFCNPPYSDWEIWAQKCSEHKNAILLIFARCETKGFHRIVFKKAHSIFFIEGRLYFYHVNGQRAKHSSGAASCLISFSEENTDSFVKSKIKGRLIILNGK